MYLFFKDGSLILKYYPIEIKQYIWFYNQACIFKIVHSIVQIKEGLEKEAEARGI